MGAFSSLLAGFGQGAGEHIADVNEKKRVEDVQNKRLANEASLEYLKNNQNLSPNDQETILRGVLKNYGHKPADIDALVGLCHAKNFGLFKPAGPAQTPGKQDDQQSQQIPSGAFPGGVGGGPVPSQGGEQPPSQGASVAPPLPTGPKIGDIEYTPLHPGVYSDPATPLL